jgi:hypothetical protein
MRSARHLARTSAKHRVGGVLLVAAAAIAPVVTGALGTSGASAAVGTDLSGAIVGLQAYGSEAHFINGSGIKVDAGKLAVQSMPCTPKNGVTKTARNNVLKVLKVPGTVSNFLTTGVVVNTGTPSFSPTKTEIVERSQVANVTLAGGLVKADAITSTAVTTLTSAGYDHHLTDGRSGVSFVNLRIGGLLVVLPSEVPANYTIPLLGIGRLILNEQTLSKPLAAPTASSPVKPSTLTVKAIHLVVDDLLGFKGGAEVATAISSIRPSSGRLLAYAYSTYVAIPGIADAGKQAALGMACNGTNGVVKSSSAVGAKVPTVVTAGVGTSKVSGKLGSTLTATASNEVAGLNLLKGTITADALVATVSSEAKADGTKAFSKGNATLVNLVIAGQPIALNVPWNTKITLPGLGFVIINQVVCANDSATPKTCSAGLRDTTVTARALHIEITVADNLLGQKIGTIIDVASATTGIST